MKIQMKFKISDWIIEILALVAMLYAFRPLLFLKRLEGSLIPIHYNIHGEVDGWGGINYLWLLLLITLFLYLILSVVGNFYYKKINYPFEITPGNEALTYEYGSRVVRYLKFILVLTFAYMGNMSITIAMGEAYSLNPFVMLFLFCCTLGVVFFFIMKLYRL